jgi:hypothetical protein
MILVTGATGRVGRGGGAHFSAASGPDSGNLAGIVRA